LMELQRKLGLTFIIVTHDQSEAMTVADRIAVMDRGRLMQVAPAAEIYERPKSRWVADFVGEINLFQGRLGDDGLSVEGTAAGNLRVAVKSEAAPGAVVWAAVRPEKVRVSREPPSPALPNCIAGAVVDIAHPRRVDRAGRGRQCRRQRQRFRLRRAGLLELASRGRDCADALRTR